MTSCEIDLYCHTTKQVIFQNKQEAKYKLHTFPAKLTTNGIITITCPFCSAIIQIRVSKQRKRNISEKEKYKIFSDQMRDDIANSRSSILYFVGKTILGIILAAIITILIIFYSSKYLIVLLLLLLFFLGSIKTWVDSLNNMRNDNKNKSEYMRNKNNELWIQNKFDNIDNIDIIPNKWKILTPGHFQYEEIISYKSDGPINGQWMDDDENDE